MADTITQLKEKVLSSVFGPLQETLQQKSRIIFSVLGFTFFLALCSFILTVVNHYRIQSDVYWIDPNSAVQVDQTIYVMAYN